MFTVRVHEENVTRSVHGRVAVQVTVAVTTAEPAEVTSAELAEHLRQHARQDSDGGWMVENHPTLGSFDSLGDSNFGALVSEAALILNGLGVSISDMPAYELGVDS